VSSPRPTLRRGRRPRRPARPTRARAAARTADDRERPLRERLVAEALALVDREGPEALTLRRIARRAGVSHGAPLRHFASLAELLAEAAAHGFALLSARIDAAAGALPPESDALARLRAAGVGYVRAAVEKPGLFALMFRPDRLDVENPRFRVEADGAFAQLLEHVRAAQDAGWQRDRDTHVVASVVWSNVHGLASLWSQGALQGAVPDLSLDDSLALALRMMVPESTSGADTTPDTKGEAT
jgi:AcrR family transcriptional regulator